MPFFIVNSYSDNYNCGFELTSQEREIMLKSFTEVAAKKAKDNKQALIVGGTSLGLTAISLATGNPAVTPTQTLATAVVSTAYTALGYGAYKAAQGVTSMYNGFKNKFKKQKLLQIEGTEQHLLLTYPGFEPEQTQDNPVVPPHHVTETEEEVVDRLAKKKRVATEDLQDVLERNLAEEDEEDSRLEYNSEEEYDDEELSSSEDENMNEEIEDAEVEELRAEEETSNKKRKQKIR